MIVDLFINYLYFASFMTTLSYDESEISAITVESGKCWVRQVLNPAMSGSDMSLRRELAKLRSLCLVICFLYVVTVARVSLRRRLDSSDPRVNTLFSIAEDIGFPRVLAERWRGSDPCQHWYGINCTDGIITTIKLINCNTTGIISLRFAELNSLSVIDL